MKYCNESGCYNSISNNISYCDIHKHKHTQALITKANNESALRGRQGQVTMTKEEGNAFSGEYECYTVQYNTKTGDYSSTSIVWKN